MSMESRTEGQRSLKKGKSICAEKYNRRNKPAEAFFPCMRTHRVD